MEIVIKRAGLSLYTLLEGTNRLENDEVVILMHGFRGDLGYTRGALLQDVAKALNQAGFATLRFDFGGCGKSDGAFEDMTVMSEILDAAKVIDFTKHQIKAKKIHLLGHSQGGVVASFIAAYYHDVITDLTLLSPAATLKEDAQKGICQGVRYDPAHIPDSLTVSGFKVGGAYFRIAQLLPIYETAQHYHGSVLLVHGSADTVVSPSASQRYKDIYSNARLHLIEGADHALTGKGNQRQEVVDLVIDYLKNHSGVK